MRFGADDSPLDGVAFVLNELFMYSMCDEGYGFAREAEVGAEGGGEGFRCKRGEQVPFDMVEEVVCRYLDVNL